MVNNSTNINKARMIKQGWSTIPPISTKQERLNSGGQQLHQYQRNKED
jgi:hypothetical protein